MNHHLPEPQLASFASDSVQILEALIYRLGLSYSFGDTKHQLQLQAVSQVLDAMAKAGVTGIGRTEVQEPLDQILAELCKKPALCFQAYYARQVLAHIPNNQSCWRQVWRRSMSLATGALTLASLVRTFDPKKLLEAFDNFSDAFSGVVQTTKDLYELAEEIKFFGSTVQETGVSLQNCFTKERRRRWYAALQFLDTCLEDGQLVQFELFARQSEFGRNEAFLLGLCQRLEQIARMQKEESLQKAALGFLGDLVKDSTLEAM